MLLVVVPVICVALFLSSWAAKHAIAVDFHHYYWPAGDRVLHGLSPYVYGPWYPSKVPVGFVYPAPAAVVFAAVSAIPRGAGDILFTALAIVGPLITLRLLDIRDWRPYAVVMLWPPILCGIQTANLSVALAVAAAAIWRYRNHARTAGVILGTVVAMKVFLLPLGFFLLATRRFAALGYATAVALALSAAAWLVVGLDEIPRYRATIRAFTQLREHYGYSVVGFVERLGGGRPIAYAIALGAAGVAALACVVQGRRGRDSAAFILALASSLLLTPIVWTHYLALLLVPIALRYPRLHPVWALPILLFYGSFVGPSTDQVGVTLVLTSATLALALRGHDREKVPPAIGVPT